MVLTVKTSAVLFVLALLYAAGAFAYASLPWSEWFPDDYMAALQAIGKCTEEENGTICARPIVRELLSKHTGADIVYAIDARLTPQQCHYLGHVVGQESYTKFGNIEEAIAQCDRSCDSACIHGVIGEAFAQELGLGSSDDVQDVDLAHLSEEDLKTVGARLCESPTACHGVGHSLFQLYHEFAPALAMCREVATEWRPNFCYQGAFMEYADILSSRNARPIDGVEYPERAQFSSLCVMPTIIESRSCFRYFPRMVVETLVREGMTRPNARKEVIDLCLAYPTETRVACIAGYGVYSAYNVLTDMPEALRTCAQFELDADKASCTLGMVSVASEERQEKLVNYCSFIPEEPLRASCFQALFFYLARIGVARESSKLLCREDALCLEQYARYQVDAWQAAEDRYPE